MKILGISAFYHDSAAALVIDGDIRLLPMVECWRSIASPKFDLTSFDHWSGTGIVDISQVLRMVK